MRQLFDGMINEAGNIETGEVYPDRAAPILTVSDGGHILRRARWGLPSPPKFHSASGIDRGVTNIRNVGSPHWRRWLGRANRCLVPVDRFAEPRPGGRGAGNAWFKLASDRGYSGGQTNLGWCYVDGNGVESNLVLALEMFRKAIHDFSDARFALGTCYRDADGVQRDLIMAACLFHCGAELGSERAERASNSLNLHEVIAVA